MDFSSIICMNLPKLSKSNTQIIEDRGRVKIMSLNKTDVLPRDNCWRIITCLIIEKYKLEMKPGNDEAEFFPYI